MLFGLPNGGTNLTRLQHSAFTQQMLAGTAYQTSGNMLGVKEPTTVDKLRGWLTGDWSRQQLDADRYFSSNEAWRGFVSYRSPWSADRLVVMTVDTSDQQLLRLHDDLNSARINAGIRGDTAIITDENGIRSFRVGPQFPSGEMPWYMMVVWYANQHSVLMALAALLLSALIGSAAGDAWRRFGSNALVQGNVVASGAAKIDDTPSSSTDSQSATGVELNMALKGDSYEIDLGSTPLGQDLSTLVGGV
ncbi:cellulose synthase 1 [Plautia stali symbiont]|nr:cellulose synthase 1 [Plautia stali symbiont]